MEKIDRAVPIDNQAGEKTELKPDPVAKFKALTLKKQDDTKPEMDKGNTHQEVASQGVLLSSRKIEVLLIAYDNGEGQAFDALIPELDEKGIDWNLLALGPAEKIFNDKQYKSSDHENRVLFCSKEFPEDYQKWDGDRTASMSAEQIKSLNARWSPENTLSGMVHTVQAQLMESFKEQGSHTIAFYDNMELPEHNSSVKPWQDYNKPVDQLLVTTKPLFNHFDGKPDYSETVSRVEHPTLQKWQKVIAGTDKQALRKALELDTRPVALVPGGYGADFLESIKVIQYAAKQCPQLQWLFTPHPREVREAESKSGVVDYEPLKTVTSYTTMKVTSIADIVLSHKSSAAWFASLMGIPTIFVRPEERALNLKDDFVEMVHDKPELLEAIPKHYNKSPEQNKVPEQVAEADPPTSIVQILKNRLQHHEKKEIP